MTDFSSLVDIAQSSMIEQAAVPSDKEERGQGIDRFCRRANEADVAAAITFYSFSIFSSQIFFFNLVCMFQNILFLPSVNPANPFKLDHEFKILKKQENIFHKEKCEKNCERDIGRK